MSQLPKQLQLFVKLMMLTTSDQDGEALVALRKANALLASQNMNWEELIAKRVTWREERQEQRREEPRREQQRRDSHDPNKKYTDEREINGYFEDLFATVDPNDSFYEFVQSVHEWWEDRGFLTHRQYMAIKRSAERRAA